MALKKMAVETGKRTGGETGAKGEEWGEMGQGSEKRVARQGARWAGVERVRRRRRVTRNRLQDGVACLPWWQAFGIGLGKMASKYGGLAHISLQAYSYFKQDVS